MEQLKISIEPVDNAYIVNDGGIKQALWYCKNENKWRNIDAQLGCYIRSMVEKIANAGSLNDSGEIEITITAKN